MIIDSDNYAAAGIETLFFPGGEPHAKLLQPITGDILLVLRMRTWNDVGFGACVLDMLARNRFLRREGRLDVFVPYFPGARQDRSDGTAPLTVKLVSELFTHLDSLPTSFAVFDIHSQQSAYWTPSGMELMPKDLTIKLDPDVVGIIAPDEGAVKRAESFRSAFYPRAILIKCTKHRDPITGALSAYHMPALPATGTYIIVDDICDGGGTFNLLAQEFKKDKRAQFSALQLFVSHGIFSKGVVNIDAKIEKIITTDSWCRENYSFGFDEPNRLEIIKLDQLYPLIMGEVRGQ